MHWYWLCLFSSACRFIFKRSILGSETICMFCFHFSQKRRRGGGAQMRQTILLYMHHHHASWCQIFMWNRKWQLSNPFLWLFKTFNDWSYIFPQKLLFLIAQLYIVAFPDFGLNPPNPEELNRLLIDHVMKQSGPMMIWSDRVEMTLGIILRFSLAFVWIMIITLIMMILIIVQMK